MIQFNAIYIERKQLKHLTFILMPILNIIFKSCSNYKIYTFKRTKFLFITLNHIQNILKPIFHLSATLSYEPSLVIMNETKN